MEKPAVTNYPIHDLLTRRWSPRAFLDRSVENHKLRQALEAARWAASCFNEQPWHYILARKENPEAFQRMLACLTPKNQMWAGAASVLLLSVARMTFTRNAAPNIHAFHDVGLATAQFVLQATSDGLSAHQMAGFDRARARETYRIPDGFDPVAAIALGYRGEPDALPDALKERELAPRVRRVQEEFVYGDVWGTPAFELESLPRSSVTQDD